jgi:TetR/AcrR family acrAB operon transcriptional repressor
MHVEMAAEKPPLRRKQADRRAEAEERLISTAIDLIAKRGVEGLRLAELGAIAGFSRALPAH